MHWYRICVVWNPLSQPVQWRSFTAANTNLNYYLIRPKLLTCPMDFTYKRFLPHDQYSQRPNCHRNCGPIPFISELSTGAFNYCRTAVCRTLVGRPQCWGSNPVPLPPHSASTTRPPYASIGRSAHANAPCVAHRMDPGYVFKPNVVYIYLDIYTNVQDSSLHGPEQRIYGSVIS